MTATVARRTPDTRAPPRLRALRRCLTDFYAAHVDPWVGPARRLPDAVIIGAQKSGTTSLFHHLAQHPEVVASKTKEVHFFDLNYRRGLGWYRYHFPPTPPSGADGVRIESSPYYLFHPRVPQRLHAHLPDARFIVMLRDPVERAYSHYWHEYTRGRETLSFPEAIAAEEERLGDSATALAEGRLARSRDHQRYSYFARGLYAEQLGRWLEFFPIERFLFIDSADYFGNPEGEMRRLADFLGIDAAAAGAPPRENVGGYSAQVDPATAKQLRAAYRQPDRELARLAGRRFSWMERGN